MGRSGQILLQGARALTGRPGNVQRTDQRDECEKSELDREETAASMPRVAPNAALARVTGRGSAGATASDMTPVRTSHLRHHGMYGVPRQTRR